MTASDVRAQEAADDDSLLAVISAAETLYKQLDAEVGVTTFRLEIARPGTPFTIELGARWSPVARSLLEIELGDATGKIGRLIIGDEHGDEYGDPERESAGRIASMHLAPLRRWLGEPAPG